MTLLPASTTAPRAARCSSAFCYYEATANKLTSQVLDPFAKIAEVKYCAVRVSKGGEEPVDLGYHSEPVVA